MRQLYTIAANAFMELVRQPIFLLVMTAASCFSIFLSSVYYFGFGDDQWLVKDSTLAVMFISGLFAAGISASASVAHEIRSGTALAVLAKPVGKAQFLIGKYIGLIGALTVLTYVNALASLLASRMSFDVYGNPDTVGLKIFYGCVILAFLLGGLTNFFARRPFVPDATLFMVVMVTFAFIVINFVDKEGHFQKFGHETDWRLIPAAFLILMGLFLLAAVALACSTRLDMIPTLAVCTAVFLVGLMSDYLFGRRLDANIANPSIWQTVGVWVSSVLYTIVPNWQLFWLSDALEKGRTIPWSYVGKALAYVVGYLGAALAFAMLLFEDRELS
ncbi:MAG TPA: ABC transporter permease [Candidatus Kapabacteria bacterium]|nr:ABC transporter permease [Candidatus Kapabacteria bacterium]